MRLKTQRKIHEQLKNDLQLSELETEILEGFLYRKKVNPYRPQNYFQIKLFSDLHLLRFDELNELYKKYMTLKAKELNKKVIHGLLVKTNTINGKLYLNQIDFIDDLETYYNILHCRLIDKQERKINGKIYDFIFDDEMLLKEPKFKEIIAIERKQKETFFKRMLIVGKANEQGKETDLSENDIENILKSLVKIDIGTKEEPKSKTIMIYDF